MEYSANDMVELLAQPCPATTQFVRCRWRTEMPKHSRSCLSSAHPGRLPANYRPDMMQQIATTPAMPMVSMSGTSIRRPRHATPVVRTTPPRNFVSFIAHSLHLLRHVLGRGIHHPNWLCIQYRGGSPDGRVFQRRCIQSHWAGYLRMTDSMKVVK